MERVFDLIREGYIQDAAKRFGDVNRCDPDIALFEVGRIRGWIKAEELLRNDWYDYINRGYDDAESMRAFDLMRGGHKNPGYMNTFAPHIQQPVQCAPVQQTYPQQQVHQHTDPQRPVGFHPNFVPAPQRMQNGTFQPPGAYGSVPYNPNVTRVQPGTFQSFPLFLKMMGAGMALMILVSAVVLFSARSGLSQTDAAVDHLTYSTNERM